MNSSKMLPTSFEQQNVILGKPKGWSDEQCMDLPVWRGLMPIDDNGAMFPHVISCWKLNKEDLETINKTGCIWLAISGNGMPPVSLFTENPFVKEEQVG